MTSFITKLITNVFTNSRSSSILLILIHLLFLCLDLNRGFHKKLILQLNEGGLFA